MREISTREFKFLIEISGSLCLNALRNIITIYKILWQPLNSEKKWFWSMWPWIFYLDTVQRLSLTYLKPMYFLSSVFRSFCQKLTTYEYILPYLLMKFRLKRLNTEYYHNHCIFSCTHAHTYTHVHACPRARTYTHTYRSFLPS